ncbi:MAG: FAD-binding oxidoreductase [Bacteroidetes bacterium]|nr:FAD-binding oxidoreductase [Bacteroidota bacterium]
MHTQLSYWEYDRWLGPADVVVAGSGIVGLNAAIRLRELHPQWRVVVAERGALPSGASTKNAGFACFGSITELADDLTHTPEDELMALAERRLRGLSLLRSRLGDTAINYEPLGGYEVFESKAGFEQYAPFIERFNNLFRKITGLKHTYINADEQIAGFGLGGVKHLIKNVAEGQINTGCMMEALIAKAQAAGVQIVTGLHITRFTETSHGLLLHTENGYEIHTQQLVVCTNGFAKQLLPELEVNPARAQVLITEPIENLRINGSFHYDRGYYYFRNVGNRVLFGGGRNLDFAAETTTAHSLTPLIQNRLNQLLRDVILPGTPHKVAMRWAGTMGIGSVKKPVVKLISPRVACAVRMGGMGVALGSLVGDEVAEMIVNA